MCGSKSHRSEYRPTECVGERPGVLCHFNRSLLLSICVDSDGGEWKSAANPERPRQHMYTYLHPGGENGLKCSPLSFEQPTHSFTGGADSRRWPFSLRLRRLCCCCCVGEWVTSCGVSCVCKLDGTENVGREKRERYASILKFDLLLFLLRRSVIFNRALNAPAVAFVKSSLGEGGEWIYST